MAQVQFIQTTPQELQQQINEGIKIQLQEFLKHFAPSQQAECLTRSDVAQMFSVDISTVSNWQKSGKLKPLGISGRVYFLRSEVEASLKPLNV